MPVKPRAMLELRVHGVNGTSPGSMLGVKPDQVAQVAGDATTGFYRPRAGVRLPGRDPGLPVAVEAYSWGALTSGVRGVLGWARRAAWLLLLPFALVNMAYWARPEIGFRSQPKPGSTKAATNDGNAQGVEGQTYADGGAARASARLVRAAGLLLTSFFVVGVCTVSIDLVAWQCYRAGVPGCPVLPDFLDFLGRDPWRAAPRRIVVGTAVPVLALGLLWLLTFRSVARCESTPDPTATADEDDTIAGLPTSADPVPAEAATRLQAEQPPADAVRQARRLARQAAETAARRLVLRHPLLWSGGGRTTRLLHLHLAFGMVVITWYSGLPVLNAGGWLRGTDEFGEWTAPSVLYVTDLLAALVGLIAMVMTLRVLPHDIEHEPNSSVGGGVGSVGSVGMWPTRLVLTAAVLLLGIHAVTLRLGTFGVSEDETYFGANLWFIAMFVVLTAIFMALFLVDRAGRGIAVIVALTTVVLLIASSLFLGSAESPLDLPDVLVPQVAWVGLGVLFVAVFIWDWVTRRPAQAWRGAGAPLLMVASVWVGLLFTTSIVTSAANYLNGPAHSVDDLGTDYEEDRLGFAIPVPASDDETSVDGKQYEATGTVRLVDAIVNVRPSGRIYVQRGRVEAEHLQANPQGGTPPSERVRLGPTQVTNARVVVPQGQVSVQDSCVRPAATADELDDDLHTRCTVASDYYVVEGVVAAALPLVVGYDDDDQGGARPVFLNVTDPPQTPLVIPQVLVWAPLGQTLWILLALAVAGVCFGLLRRKSKSTDFDKQLGDDGIAASSLENVRATRVRAALAHRAEAMLTLLGPMTGLLALGVLVGAETGRAPWDWMPWLREVATLSLWVTVGSAAGLIWVASRLRTSEKARRGVGVLWDLCTFWPRAAHPFAPPCYAERVVPEIVTRVRWAQGAGNGQPPRDLVVLSGHSQGSLIVIAAASRLTKRELDRVRVITYGSQIRAWYGRIFPGVFGPQAVGYEPTTAAPNFRTTAPEFPQTRQAASPATARRFASNGSAPNGSLRTFLEWEEPRRSWVNLYRTADPLGFHVYSDVDSDRDTWIREVPLAGAGDPGARVMTHSGYQHTEPYITCVEGWAAECVSDGQAPSFQDVTAFAEP